jgi:inactivated superfamily I helicase
MISYVYPVFRKSEPIIMLYVLKLDFTRSENPVLFWNVQQKIYEQQIADEEDEALKKYFQLREKAEKLEIEKKKLEELKIAREYYKTRHKELQEKIKELEKIVELRQKAKAR